MKTLTKLLLCFIALQVYAQEITVKGTVADEAGLPLAGAAIYVKAEKNATRTNINGQYEINVEIGQTLVFSYIGYTSQERIVSEEKPIHITLLADSTSLDEVVVTGYGIPREKKALGYAVSTISSEKVGRKRERDVIRTLKGKVAGVKIGDENTNTIPDSGQLTAAEINDIEKWNDWKKSVSTQEGKNIQQRWGFDYDKKLVVTVTDKWKNSIPNVKVALYNNKKKLFIAKTDAEGRAILFRNKTKVNPSDSYMVQIYDEGRIIGKSISRDKSELNITLKKFIDTQGKEVDVMFTIDATGSMGDEMNYLKSELQNIISRLDKSIQQKRLALTFYRDKGDEFVVQQYDFDTNIDKMKDVLASHNANGGGDYEEAVEEALKISMQQSWNPTAQSKLLFLLLDAPPHFTVENVAIIKEQMELAREMGIKIIPIVASDANKEVEFLMRFFSISTNGTYVFLTDDSGIGNDHLEPTAADYEIEKLNDLIVRLIEKYAGVIS